MLRPVQIAIVVASIGLAITLAVAWTAWKLNAHNEHRLLEVQTRQAAAVISSAILGIEEPLTTALQIEAATGGQPEQFRQYMSAETGPGRLFVSASLWEGDSRSLRPVVSVGVPPVLAPGSGRASQLRRQLISPAGASSSPASLLALNSEFAMPLGIPGTRR